MYDTESIWTLTVIGGPIILGAIIAYALIKQRRLRQPEQARQNQAVKNLYDDPDGSTSPAGDARSVEAEVRAPQK